MLSLNVRQTITVRACMIFLCFGVSNVALGAEQCATLDQMLVDDTPRVVQYVLSLSKKSSSRKLKGVRLCDGSHLFRGWDYLGRVGDLDSYQFLFLFRESDSLRAVGWVLDGGTPIDIPKCPPSIDCANADEGAYIISGDVYTWSSIQPARGVVIIRYPPAEWKGRITSRSTREKGSGVFWMHNHRLETDLRPAVLWAGLG